MEKIIKSAVAIGMVAFGLGSINLDAAQITHTPGAVINPGFSFSSFFDLTTQGFNSSLHEVTSASALFVVTDVSGFPGGPENITIELDGSFFASAVNFIGSVVAGGSILNLSLLNDGSLGYEVIAAAGPGHVFTVLNVAVLNFEFGNKTPVTSVPDGGSVMALIGLSVMGLGYAGRRMRA